MADTFGASASLKGSYRRPELCRWRFQQLTRAVELENDPEAFAALNLDKGSARVVMSRSLPLEDETARLHFQAVAHSCSSYAKIVCGRYGSASVWIHRSALNLTRAGRIA